MFEEDTFVDKQPPMKTAEEYLQEELKSARTGVALLLLLCFTLGRSVQLFSRKVGTSGELAVLGSLISVAGMSGYYLAVAETQGHGDQFALPLLLAVAGPLLIYEIVAAAMRPKGSIGSHHLGQGILQPWFPTMSSESVGYVSDVAVALSFGLVFHALSSPIQGNWFFVMAGCVTICQAWKSFLFRTKQQRIRRVASRSSRWSPKARNW